MAKKKSKSIKQKNESDEIFIPKSKGTRSLVLPESMNEKFNSIKNFGNFDAWFFHKYMHLFYSLGVCDSALDLYSNPNLIQQSNFEEQEVHSDENDKTKVVNTDESDKMKNTINSDQLNYYDDLFRIISYWYLLKKGDNQPYRVLKDINLSRKICQNIFLSNFDNYFEKISDFDSKNPNIDVLSLIFDNETLKEFLAISDIENSEQNEDL